MKKTHFFISLLLTSCIGTDLLDDPLVPRTLTVEPTMVMLLVNNTQQLTFNYTNEYGLDDTISPIWTVENTTVATVNSEGLITAVAKGQTTVKALYEDVESKIVLINVVENSTDVAKVLIESPVMNLAIGASVQLNATAWNIENMPIEGLDVTWKIDNNSIATIDQSGLLTGIADGTVLVTASIEGIRSESLSVAIGAETKTAQFSSRNGYKAEGTATLQKNGNGELILTFSSDFKTSFALGTYIYMSNNESGSDTKASGLELAQITTNGEKTFNITAINSNATLNTYRYVVILCKPAPITFGVADFN